MKLCFLAPANSIHSYRWITYFLGRGHDITWLSLHPLMFDLSKNITFHHIGMGLPTPFNYIHARWAIKRYLDELKPDILHIHSLNAYGVGALNDFQPLVLTAWGSDVLFAGENIMKKKFVQRILRRAKCVTCDAIHMKDAMRTLVPELDNVRQINFGIDTDVFRPLGRDEVLQYRLGVEASPSVVSLRSLLPVYDLATLIRAVPLVVRDVPAVKFFIVGTGPQEGALKDLVNSLNVSANVVFLGKIENAMLPIYLSQMDVYVSTSLSDAGIAASTAEAMSCGLSVVVTDSGENSLWINNGQNGFVVPSGNYGIIAEKVSMLLRDSRLRELFGKAGRATIEERNDYRREMEKMEVIYAGLVL